MVLTYLPLINDAIDRLRYIPRWTTREDLAQEAFFFLIDAIDCYDSSRSSNIELYIIYYIYFKLLDFVDKRPLKFELLNKLRLKHLVYLDSEKWIELIEARDSVENYKRFHKLSWKKQVVDIEINRKINGECIWCGDPLAENNKNYCERHRVIRNAQRQKSRSINC